jgi:hypothetical protein
MAMSETPSMSDGEKNAEAAMAPAPKPVAAKTRTRRFSGFLAIAALILLAGAGMLTLQRFRTNPLLQANRAEIAALKNDVAALNARVATLENSAAQMQTAGAQLTDFAMRLGALETDAARSADRDTLGQLQNRVTRLESASPAGMFQTAAATLARANLLRAAAEAAPFQAELDALRAAAPEDAALGPLQAFAKTGVPTRTMLAQRFGDAAVASLEAERVDPAGAGFFQRLWSGLRRLVSVRRIGNVQGTSNEDRLARAQDDLDKAALAAAVTEARAIAGPAAAPLASWIKDAESRIALDRAAADLRARIVLTVPTPDAALSEPAPPSEITPAARQSNRSAKTAPAP